MGRNLKYLTALFSLMVLYGAYYWGIPAIINIPQRTEFIEQSVLEKTGYKIKLVNPTLKMGIIPSVWFKADDIAILNDDNSKALDLKEPCVNIRLLPLVFKRIDINHFSSDHISANFVFDKNSEFKLGQYKIDFQTKSPFELYKAFINIDGYNINLEDKVQNKLIKFNGQYLSIDNFENNKHLNLSTLSEIKTGSKNAFVKLDLNLKLPVTKISNDQCEISGHIVNLDLSDFSDYVKAISKNKIEKLSGIINFTTNTVSSADNHKQIRTNLYLKDFGIYKKTLAESIYLEDKLEIKTDINTIKNGININEMGIKGNGIDAFINGEISKLNSKLPNLDLQVTINNSKAEKIISLLPGDATLSPDINLLLLKQTGFWADVTGNLDIKGKADTPNVTGNILVSNAYLLKPIKNAKKAIIKLAFTGKATNIDVTVPTSPNETVFVKGPINLYGDKYADLHITSTNNVDLKTAQIVLNPLHDILHFDLGPVPIMDIKGKGGINLHVLGTRKNPHGWGKFYFNNATVSFLDIHNMVVTNGAGELNFDNQNTIFQSKKAYLNGKPISIKGTCSLNGDLNFNITANNQNLQNLLKIIKTSPMLADIQKITAPIDEGNGLVNLFINLKGQVKDPKDIVFNKNIFANGKIELLGNNIKIKNVIATISKVSGLIDFENLNANFNLKSTLNNSTLNISGKIDNNECKTKIISNSFNLGDGISMLPQNIKIPFKKDFSTINTSFVAKYNGSIENINYDNINLKGKIYSNKGAKSSIIVDSSNYELKNSTFKMPLIKGKFKNSPFKISANINKTFSNKPIVNGEFNINSLNLNLINDKDISVFLPTQTSQILNDIEFLNGHINISSKIRNNEINAFSKLDDIILLYKPKHIKLTVKSGNMLLRHNKLNLNKINAQLGQMPVFINGIIEDIYKNPYANIYINAKPTQEFFEQFINNKALYPVKLKGDAILSSKIKGTQNNLNTKSILNIAENSSLYYMGASIGDPENPVKITLDCDYYPNKIKINDLQYDKIITSQNNRPFANPQLNASGTLSLTNNNIIKFGNFKVKTQTPTDAKIFNIIFRKPFMKQGVFTSDLVLNGTSINPKIKGELDITSIDIPFFDSAIHDVKLNFKNDKLYITSKGTVLTNDVNLYAVMKNKLTPPYIIEDFKLKLATLNVNKITDTMRDIEAEATRNPSYNISSNTVPPFDITQLIVYNGNIAADKIIVRNINADNFSANLNINKDHILNAKNFKFDIAEGAVVGDFKYNLDNNMTALNINLNRANALIMSEALFDLKGQVYGSVNGDFTLSCKGDTQENCFKTLSGDGTFKIANGRMPKLGSLEYLLKAGNLLKGGFTGLSINSLIDLVTPLKTGDFESISGDVHLSNGIAKNINIYSNGNDLNMYMTGSYNVVTSIADMKIYGSLTKNITTVFGKIKNASLNTLFNTIPGISDATEKLLLQEEISKIPSIKDATNIYRIFTVDINGDINGTNYVKSFKWVK